MGFDDMFDNLTEEQIMQAMNNVDDEQIMQAMGMMIDNYLVPHLDDIRVRANTSEPAAEARAYYESLPENEQAAPPDYEGATREGEFYFVLDNLVGTLVKCRYKPKVGFPELKSQIRDPYTLEALLLIFENDEHIDSEYTQQLKEFGATHVKWAGAMMVPEMYDDAEAERILQEFSPESDGDTTGYSAN